MRLDPILVKPLPDPPIENPKYAETVNILEL